MAKMHENEFEIDELLVHALLEEQCPQWAYLPLHAVASSGTDNALFRLGNEYVVRLPRVEWAVGSVTTSIAKEFEWIPKISRLLKIPISEPVFKGSANSYYSWPWIVAKWHDGYNPLFEQHDEYELLAQDVAIFLNELHGISLANGPASRRGVALHELDKETRQAISELEGEVDVQAVTSLWTRLTTISSWNKKPLWVHGDFLPGNILVQDNRLRAVIDFSDVGMGDPACDLVIAWSLFNAHSRQVFRAALDHIDDATWERGRGWALSIALIMLPYYKNSNPTLALLARRMINNVFQGSV